MGWGAGIGGALTALGGGLGRHQERKDALKQLLLSLSPNLKDKASVETAMELLGMDDPGGDIDVDALAAFGQDPYRERIGKAKQFVSTVDESSPYLDMDPGDILGEFNVQPGSPGAEAAGMVDQFGPWDPSKATEFTDVSPEGGAVRRSVPHAYSQIEEAQRGRQRGFDRTSKRAGLTASEQAAGTVSGTMGGTQDFIAGMSDEQKQDLFGTESMYRTRGTTIGAGMGAEALTDAQQTALHETPAFLQDKGREASAAIHWDPKDPLGYGPDEAPGVSRRGRARQQTQDSAAAYAGEAKDRMQVVPTTEGYVVINLDDFIPESWGPNKGAFRRLPPEFGVPSGGTPSMMERIYQSMLRSGNHGTDRNEIMASPAFRAAVDAMGGAMDTGLGGGGGGGGGQTPEEIAAEQARIDEIIRAIGNTPD
jgi:hypothetical protein